MKRIAMLCLLALLIGGFCASGAHATVSRGLDCRQCHSFSNQRPVANAGSDQTVNSAASATLNGSGSTDADDGIASHAWRQTGGTAVSLTNASTSRSTFTAPSVTASTVLTFQLTVTDRFNQAATDTCTVTVRAATPPPPTNLPPVANAGQDQTVTAGNRVTLNGVGSSDPDDGIATYAWTQSGAPAVTLSSVSAANPTFTAPQVTAATSLSFRLTVTDRGGQSSTDTCVVRVNPSGGTTTNAPPVANAGLDTMVLPGTLNTLDGFSSIDPDPDDGIATYAWEQTGGPAVTLSDAAAMDPVFQAPYAPATLTFRLVVTDQGGLQDSDTCTVEVLSTDSGTVPPPTANKPPVANAGQDRTVRSDSTVRLSGSGSTDPDDGIASYRWRQISGTSVSLSGAASSNASFVAPRVSSRGATLTFKLTVKDRAGLSASDTIAVSVTGSDDEEDDD